MAKLGRSGWQIAISCAPERKMAGTSPAMIDCKGRKGKAYSRGFSVFSLAKTEIDVDSLFLSSSGACSEANGAGDGLLGAW